MLSGVFYSLLMLLAIAASVLPDVAEAPQNGWFTLMYDYGGTWLLGLAVTMVFAASMGHIDGSVQVCGLQIANDIIRSEKRPLTDTTLTYVAKSSMIVFMAAAALVAYLTFDMARLQLLAQISYQGIVQLAVPLFLGIFWRGGNKYGAVAGMSVGFLTAVALTWFYPDDIAGLGSLTGGVVALALNLVVYLVVSAMTGISDDERSRVDALFVEAARPTAITSPAEAKI
ncbi:hypothetical protein P9209_02845 [Prescottella defluvii]|nr:hypothetical protein P9209_02845 [Prescottella defluvii]